jgi:hypothetical protein
MGRMRGQRHGVFWQILPPLATSGGKENIMFYKCLMATCHYCHQFTGKRIERGKVQVQRLLRKWWQWWQVGKPPPAHP